MPYIGSSRLPAEFASKTSHIDILQDDFVKELVKTFEKTNKSDIEDNSKWESYKTGDPLSLIFSADGSFQIISSDHWPYRKMAFVKIALVVLNNNEIEELDKENPHPMKIRDILADSSLYHGTMIPLQHIKQKGMSSYDTIRNIIFRSMKDPKFEGQILETLKWIAYKKWDGKDKNLELFQCPHCLKDVATLPYNSEEGECPVCNNHLFLTDMLGFHQEMSEDYAQETIVTSYMSIYETLALFTCIRYFWENNRDVLKRCFFVKDGPLSIRAQYSKLVEPIRQFLELAKNESSPVYLMGQEKDGRFAEHLKMIEREAPDKSVFIPGDKYIKEDVQQRPLGGQEYGFDTNYGNKVFVKINDHHSLMLNIPTGKFNANPNYDDLIGIDRIIGTLNSILSSRYEAGLIPIELAHNIASLSTYPSAKLLKLLAEEAGLL